MSGRKMAVVVVGLLLGAAITVHERQAEDSGSAVLTLAFAEAARVHERTQWPRWNAENGAVAKQPPPPPRTDMGHMGRKREQQQTQVLTPVGVEDMPSPMTDPMAQAPSKLTQTVGSEKRQKAPGERDWVKRMHHVAAPSIEAQLKSASPAEPRLEHDHKAALVRQAEAVASQKVLGQLASEASAIVDKGSVDAAAKTSTRSSTSTTNSKRRSEAQAVHHLMHHLMEQVDWIVRN